MQIVSEFRKAVWNGNRSVTVYQKIVDGPTTFVDRRVELRLSFEDIEHLKQLVAYAENQLRKSN